MSEKQMAQRDVGAVKHESDHLSAAAAATRTNGNFTLRLALIVVVAVLVMAGFYFFTEVRANTWGSIIGVMVSALIVFGFAFLLQARFADRVPRSVGDALVGVGSGIWILPVIGEGNEFWVLIGLLMALSMMLNKYFDFTSGKLADSDT